MFIRYFATTDPASPVAAVALEYLRSLIRIAPVRVIDPGRMIPGTPDGPWARHHGLFYTPMVGDYVNVVCTEPSRWTWVQRVSAPKTNKPDAEVEHIDGRLELYTKGVRNVLLVAAGELSRVELEAALKYEALVLAAKMSIDLFGDCLVTSHGTRWWPVPVPVHDHRSIRAAVMGIVN